MRRTAFVFHTVAVPSARLYLSKGTVQSPSISGNVAAFARTQAGAFIPCETRVLANAATLRTFEPCLSKCSLYELSFFQ
jgi:hypothetical protein